MSRINQNVRTKFEPVGREGRNDGSGGQAAK